MVASRGLGIHLQGAIATCKRPLHSQLSCLHLPGSSAWGFLAAVAIPWRILYHWHKSQVLKGHREDGSGMVGGPDTHRCQWLGDVMQPVVAGMRGGHRNRSPQGFWMGGQECKKALPCSRLFPSQSVPSLPTPQQGPGSSHPYRCVCFFV